MRMLIIINDKESRTLVGSNARTQFPNADFTEVTDFADLAAPLAPGDFDLYVVEDASAVQRLRNAGITEPIIATPVSIIEISQCFAVGADDACLVWEEGELRQKFFNYKP